MLAPLATLAFLTVLWLVVLTIAELGSPAMGKIVAALKGRSVMATAPIVRPVAARVSQRSRPQRSLHAQPQLRAAA